MEKIREKIKTIEAVTTLAFDRRRSDFYKKQLFAALRILDQGLVIVRINLKVVGAGL